MTAAAPLVVRRAVTADALDILAWRNDPLTRAMSKNQDAIGEAQHLAWFEAAVADPRRLLLVAEVGGVKIGMVRFDFGQETEVSINLGPEHRGRGYSLPLLLAALDWVEGDVWAEIRDENAASQHLFARAGFERRHAADGVGRYLRKGR